MQRYNLRRLEHRIQAAENVVQQDVLPPVETAASRRAAYRAWRWTPKGRFSTNYPLLAMMLEYLSLGSILSLALTHRVYVGAALDALWLEPPDLLYLFALLPKKIVTVRLWDRTLVRLSSTLMSKIHH